MICLALLFNESNRQALFASIEGIYEQTEDFTAFQSAVDESDSVYTSPI